MSKTKNFSLEFQTIRKKLGISQEAMGARLGRSVRTIQRWESGRSSPTPEALILARAWIDPASIVGHYVTQEYLNQ